MDHILEAIRDVRELYIGLFGSDTPPCGLMRERLAVAVTGADTPGGEEDHAARDAQFEMYTYGLLCVGGLNPWWCEPPDLAFVYRDTPVGVAVKRLWSQEQAKKRLSLGSEQLAIFGRGIVATNANEYVPLLAPGTFPPLHRDAWRSHTARLRGHLPYLTEKPHVIGLLLCALSLEWERSPQGIGLRGAFYTDFVTLRDGPCEDGLATLWRDQVVERAQEWHTEHDRRLAAYDAG